MKYEIRDQALGGSLLFHEEPVHLRQLRGALVCNQAKRMRLFAFILVTGITAQITPAGAEENRWGAIAHVTQGDVTLTQNGYLFGPSRQSWILYPVDFISQNFPLDVSIAVFPVNVTSPCRTTHALTLERPWLAVANGGVSGQMVRDLMIAADTADTTRALGLKLLFTPGRSPESNRMSESFLKTLKRHYARLSVLPDANTILAKFPGWIEDYCEVHPHSGLKFRSPREFIRPSA